MLQQVRCRVKPYEASFFPKFNPMELPPGISCHCTQHQHIQVGSRLSVDVGSLLLSDFICTASICTALIGLSPSSWISLMRTHHLVVHLRSQSLTSIGRRRRHPPNPATLCDRSAEGSKSRHSGSFAKYSDIGLVTISFPACCVSHRATADYQLWFMTCTREDRITYRHVPQDRLWRESSPH